jgi:hypothetical protein
MVVHPHVQAGRGGHDLAGRDIVPAQQGVLHDHPVAGIDPSAGGHAESQQRPAAGVLTREPRDPLGQVAEHRPGFGAGVGDPFPRDDPAPQVEQGQRRVPDGEVQAARDVAAGVDIHRHVGAAGSVARAGPGGVTEQARTVQVGAQPADRGRAESGETGDGAPGHRSVVQGRLQDGGGAGRPPVIGRPPDVLAPDGGDGGRVRGHA